MNSVLFKKRVSQRIPQTVIDAILDRICIEDIVRDSIHLVSDGSVKRALCPFHVSDSRDKTLVVDRSEKSFRCDECSFHGSSIGWLMHYDGLSFQDSIVELAKLADIDVSAWIDDEGLHLAREKQYELLNPVTKYYKGSLAGSRAETYLQEREVTPSTQERFSLGYAPLETDSFAKTFSGSLRSLWNHGHMVRRKDGTYSARFKDRLMFPIRDEFGDTLAYGARALSDSQMPKYLNSARSRIFDKSRTLYGLYESLSSPLPVDSMLLVEGYMDVILLNQVGAPHVVAALGTSVSGHHIETIYSKTPNLVVCLDGDYAGRQAAERVLHTALPYLRDDENLEFAFMPNGHDPDSLIRSSGYGAFRECVANAMDWTDFLIKVASDAVRTDKDSDITTASIGQQAAFCAVARPMVRTIQSLQHKEFITTKIMDTLDIDNF